MHWPFAGPILILSVIVCLIPLLLLIIDVVINYKSVKTSYGYSYLLILLPSLLFLQTNLGIFYKDINSKDMIALKQTDDHRQLYCNRQDKINCLFIERNFKEDSLITKIYKTTEELLSLIDETRNKLIASTGGYIEGDKNGMYKGAREKTTVEVMMVGASKNGRAYELKSVLEAYTSLLNKNIADNAFLIIPIALDAKDDPVVTDWDLKRKDFASLNFSEVTMLQALSKLSQLELEVIIAEKDFLLYYQSTHKEIPPTNN
ncbi:MAG TPA: hypothetical protein VNW99_13685 [Cytophagaceae bacterium]|nr:hypothetical protein [Cytophagaceae bacterium]